MNRLSKYIAGAAVAAVASVSLAAPADAQRYRHRDHDGIDTGDVIAGVAILGGIAAIASAMDRDGRSYGYNNRYRYRDDYRNAVNACAYEAERYARGGRISITDVDRRSSRSYRVRGVIDGFGGGYGRGDRYDRYDRYDRRDRYDRGGYGGRTAFACTARNNGRVTDFDVNRW